MVIALSSYNDFHGEHFDVRDNKAVVLAVDTKGEVTLNPHISF
jgi:hypothetical protein